MDTETNSREKLEEEIPLKDEQASSPGQPDLEHLWQFAGQGLRSSDFTSAMVHFYRGEMTRANTWRVRLDSTTNWAVVTTGAALTFSFGSTDVNSAIVILIDSLLVLLFLFIEARRYRYYELWANRVRIMETNFFAGLLSPPFLPTAGWAEQVTGSLKQPRFPISLMEAIGRRYRRNYAPIFLILAISWNVKILLHPLPAQTWQTFLTRAAIGPIPGWFVILFGFLFNGALIALGFFTVGMRESTSEVLGEVPQGTLGWVIRAWDRIRRVTWDVLETELPLPPMPKRQPRKQLVYVISDEVEVLGKALLEKVGRGVTLLHGTGMYTGKTHGILMCALEARQIPLLKRVVNEIDPHAFVIVMPIQEVRGEGFRPLEA